VSPPVTDSAGALPVAAFVTVNSFTADAVVVNLICSLPFASAIKPPFAILGAVSVLFVKVFVPEIVSITTPSTARTPAESRDNVVSVACPTSKVPTPKAEDVEAVIQETGKLVQFVSVPEAGVPKAGVVKVGLVSVLFVSVCDPVKVTTDAGNDTVAELMSKV